MAMFMIPGTDMVKTAAISPGKALRKAGILPDFARLNFSFCVISSVKSFAFQIMAPIPSKAVQRLKKVR